MPSKKIGLWTLESVHDYDHKKCLLIKEEKAQISQNKNEEYDHKSLTKNRTYG